jgi:ABC-type sugar transport system substrate-binding protein
VRLSTKLVAIAASVLLLLPGTAACSRGGDSSSSSGGGTGDDRKAAAEVEKLLAGKVEFAKPTAPITPGSHKVAVVASGLASPGPSRAAKSVAEGLAKAGWTAAPAGDGKFTPTAQTQLIGKAVLDKVEGIILISITPAAVAAAVKSAQAANIPIVCILCGPGLPPGMVGVSYNSTIAGQAQAAYAVAKTKPGATIVVYQNAEFEDSRQQSQATAARIRQLCPTCKVEKPSLLLAEATQPNAPLFVNLLTSHPSGRLDAVVMPFDSPAGALANTASQLGRSDFSIIGFGGLAPFIDMVGTGKPPVAAADVLIPTPYIGWVAVDQMVRVLAKQPTWESNKLPVQLVNKNNYATFPANDVNAQPGFDYKATFASLWGK